jgi:hypothetical protein
MSLGLGLIIWYALSSTGGASHIGRWGGSVVTDRLIFDLDAVVKNHI